MSRGSRVAGPALLLLGFAPSLASADATAPAAAAAAKAATTTTASPSFASVAVDPASLPSGEILDVDRTGMPSALPAGLKVEGVHVAVEELKGQTPGRDNHYATVTVPPPPQSKTDAKSEQPSPHREADDNPFLGQTCFDVARPNTGGLAFRRASKRGHRHAESAQDANETPEPEHWSLGTSSQTSMSRYPYAQKIDDRVQLLHVETFETVASGPQLRARNVWVDVVTGGARLQRQAILPLRDLGGTLPGTHLYAGKTASDVIFVETHDRNVEQVFAMEGDGAEESSNCGHMMLPLSTMKGWSAEAAFIVRAVRRVPSDPKEPDGAMDTTTRTGHVTLSTQWETNEPAPLVAFSSGWDSREKANE